jgi:hypothetical protein
MSEAAGFQFPPTPVAWLKRDLLVFANSIGIQKDELQFLYVRAGTFAAARTSYLS